MSRINPIFLVFADRGDGRGVCHVGQHADKTEALRLAHNAAGPRNFIIYLSTEITAHRLDFQPAEVS